jgi:hypothetical protein
MKALRDMFIVGRKNMMRLVDEKARLKLYDYTMVAKKGAIISLVVGQS